MVDIVAHVRLQHDFLVFPGHAATIDELSHDVTNFSHVCMRRDVLAIRQNKSRKCIRIFFQSFL